MVGERRGPAASLRRVFVATDAAGPVTGYLSFSPVYGRHAGWLPGLSRRRPDVTPGTMELVTLTAIERFRYEGAAYLHFGLTPFTGLSEEHEVSGHSRVVARLVRLLAAHGKHIHPGRLQAEVGPRSGPARVRRPLVEGSPCGRSGPCSG